MSRLRQAITHNFTIVELLVVVAIMLILMSLTLPALKNAMECARLTKCESNLHQIGAAVHLYGEDNYDCIVPVWGTKQRLSEAVKEQAIGWTARLFRENYCSKAYECPSDLNPYEHSFDGESYKASYGLSTSVGGNWTQANHWHAGPGYWNEKWSNVNVAFVTFRDLARTQFGMLKTPIMSDRFNPPTTANGVWPGIHIHLNHAKDEDALGDDPPAFIHSRHYFNNAAFLFADGHAKILEAPFAPRGENVYWLSPISNHLVEEKYIRW